MTRIEGVVQESSNIRTFVFRDELSTSAKPGQFAMIWLPAVGEFPMSLSIRFGKDLSSITVKAAGEGSKRLYESRKGDIVGVRGPYGNSFDLSTLKSKSRVLLVGGGTGLVPIAALAKEIASRKRNVRATAILAARTKNELPFLGFLRKCLGRENVFPTTDDGTLGYWGLAHEKLEEILEVSKSGFSQIFCCGPEKMMLAVYKVARQRNIPSQFSLERIMKCGIGLCGSCTIGKYVLCKDGPVLTHKELGSLEREFGVAQRDKAGKLVRI